MHQLAALFAWTKCVIYHVLFCHVTQELLESGYLTEVHKFSKFIHGSCTLTPELVQVGST